MTGEAGLAALGEVEFGVAADGPHDAGGGMAGSEEEMTQFVGDDYAENGGDGDLFSGGELLDTGQEDEGAVGKGDA